MAFHVIEKKVLGVCNRDGEAFAVRIKHPDTESQRLHYLVLEADTFHNDEVFEGMGSTQQVEISEEAYEAL